MQGPDSNQAGATLATLANAANEAEERDEAAPGAASAGEKKKNTQYQPITDEAELAALRSQGLTTKGESKVTKGDLRCRPPRAYSETFFDKKLPQFRLRTVIETARAEDVVMAWAFVTKRDTKLRANEFRFDHKNYLEDEALVAELKNLGNSSDAMVAYLKGRFGTLREPKREITLPLPTTTTTATGTATVYNGSIGTSEQATLPATQVQEDSQQHFQLPSGAVGKKANEEYTLAIKTARQYFKEFKDELVKRKKEMQMKKEETPSEVVLTQKEEDMCTLRALHKAAWDGQAKATFDLATRVKDFNARFKFNYTPLHQAVHGSVGDKRRTNMLTAERLIDAGGAEVSVKDIFGRTPLHYASRRGDLGMINLLISKGAEVNAVASNGSTPLHCAAESGGLAAVELLLANGARETSPLARVTSLDFPQRRGSSGGISDPGSLGIRQGSVLSRGTSAGSSVEALTPVQQCGTALHWAARAGQYDVVEHLLDAKFDSNAQDWHGTTPLQAAAREYKEVFPDRLEVGNYRSYITNKRKIKALPPAPLKEKEEDRYLAVMRYLLGRGADREVRDADGRTALHVAAACGNLKCVKLLLSGKDNSMFAQNDKLGYDPVMLSVINSEEIDVGSTNELGSVNSEREFWKSIDDLLTEWNVNDNKDNRGRTALHLAALGGKTKVAEDLIKRGADVDAKDESNATPLLMAARAQHLECVKVLLENKPDIDAMDKLGCSSLSASAYAGDLNIVEMLLEHGANVNLEKSSENGQAGDEGRTALHDAAEAGNPHVVNLLIKHGASVNHAGRRGKTPLHVAARYGNTDVVQALLDTPDIDINARDCKGRTALEIAEQHGLVDIMDLLKQQEGNAAGKPLVMQNASERQPSPLLPCGDAPEDNDYGYWKGRFNLLNAFVQAYERVPAPDEWYLSYPIGSWVELQKEKIRWDEMPEEELQAIGSVGRTLKDWGVGIPWMDWLQSIKEYVAANDKLPSAVAPKEPDGKRQFNKEPTPTRNIDKKVLDLGWWCKFQQCRKSGKVDGRNKSSLDRDQVKELQALRQWKWETPEDRKRQRILLCLRLHLFCMKYKRFPRPDEHYLGVPLGQWCEVIRKLKLWSDLPLERQQAIERCVLNTDGTEIFQGSRSTLWNKFCPSFEDHLECLKAFVREKGRLPSQKDGSHSINIGMWWSSQRQKSKSGQLAPERQHAIEEIFKSNSISPPWVSDRDLVNKDKDVPMTAPSAAGALSAGKNVKDEAEKDEDVKDTIPSNSLINQKIKAWVAKASGSTELKSAEVLEWIQACKQRKVDIVTELPSQPEGGRSFLLERSSKFRQDGYKWKKESRSVLKVNGEDALQCCYANTTDGTLQRRIYWELARPNLVSHDLVFVHYLNKRSSPLKRAASEAGLDAKSAPSSMAAMDMLASAAAATGPPSTDPKNKTTAAAVADIQPFDVIVEDPVVDIEDGSDNEPPPKRSKYLHQGGEKQEAVPSPRSGKPSPASLEEWLEVLKRWKDENPGKHPIHREEFDDEVHGVVGLGNWLSSRKKASLAVGNKEAQSKAIAVMAQITAILGKWRAKEYDGKSKPASAEEWLEVLKRWKAKNPGKRHPNRTENFDDDVHGLVKLGSWLANRKKEANGTAGKSASQNDAITLISRITAILTEHPDWWKVAEKEDYGKLKPALPPPAQVDTKMEDAFDKKAAPETSALPAKVVEMVSTASLDNQFAMSTALKALYDNGIGGSAMRWAASQMAGVKMEADQKKFLFQAIKEYVENGDLEKAAEWVEDMKAAF